jgi:beta-galactosidase
MYSIGNEIPDTGGPGGTAWGRKIAEKIRSLDSTRYIINSMNPMVSLMDQLQEKIGEAMSGDINTAMTDLGSMMKNVMTMDLVTTATAEAFAVADIAGYNYADTRYIMDKDLFPNRIICGSETFPKDIANNWKLVKENGYIIGDFTWTGWDYLGEAGIGKVEYGEASSASFMGGYPWKIAYCGDIDITGNRRPVSYYREIVFGLRKEPYIAVQRPHHYHEQPITTPWSWSDSISSWTWPGFEGKSIRVEVYSDADEVELFVNGKSVGKAPVGEEKEFKAIFNTVYEPGEIKAVAYVNGEETGSMSLQTAGDGLKLRLDSDRDELKATGQDLAYVMISLTDENGILQTARDRKVSIKVEGAGVLQGFGSANPRSTENFFDTEATTFDGKVLAVIRSEREAGHITVTASAEDCEPKTITIRVV